MIRSFGFCVLLMLTSCSYAQYQSGNVNDKKKKEKIPEIVIEFGRKYPEAKEFVENFNKYKNVEFDMDITKEMSGDGIPLFIQWDKRWGYKSFGKNYVGVAGCGPTCLAMVVCGLTKNKNVNPHKVSQYTIRHGFYKFGQGTSWQLMSVGAKHYGLQVKRGKVSVKYILKNLKAETPMICSVAPGDFTKTGHFIVLTGIDENNKITVHDPNSPTNSKKHWKPETVVSQMKCVWIYSNTKTATDKYSDKLKQ